MTVHGAGLVVGVTAGDGVAEERAVRSLRDAVAIDHVGVHGRGLRFLVGAGVVGGCVACAESSVGGFSSLWRSTRGEENVKKDLHVKGA